MNETKRIIVEYGMHRQQIILTDRLISTSKLLNLIGNRFDMKFDNKSLYILQMYDNILNEYHSLNDNQIIDLVNDNEKLHRFRIVNKSVQSQKHHLVNNLRSTVGKLHNAIKDINQIQNLVGTLNQNCDILNQLMDTHQSKSSFSTSTCAYLLDPAIINKDNDITKPPVDNDSEDENFESVSCYGSAPIFPVNPPPLIPTIINLHKQQLTTTATTDNNIQTRIIPCKYAVRGTCRLDDKCLYLHDEGCIQSAREWERRL